MSYYKPSSIKLVEYNLLKMSDEKVWARLLPLTLPMGLARGAFEDIQSRSHSYEKAKICVAKVNGRIVAWAFVNKLAGMTYSSLWAFTHPSYRQKGLQSEYLMPYWAKREKKCGYQNDNLRRKKTFAAYERAKA